MQKLPDLEKLLARIFTYSIKHHVDAIYFEDVSLTKMKEFKTLLDCFKNLDHTLEGLISARGSLKSRRLQLLLESEE